MQDAQNGFANICKAESVEISEGGTEHTEQNPVDGRSMAAKKRRLVLLRGVMLAVLLCGPVVGVVAGCRTARFIDDTNVQGVNTALSVETAAYIHLMMKSLSTTVADVETVRDYVATTPGVTEGDFRGFIRRLKLEWSGDTYNTFIGFAYNVRHEMRESVEEELSSLMQQNFSLRDGRGRPREAFDHYFPLLLLQPFSPFAYGFDLSSSSVRKDTLNAAGVVRETVLSVPLELVGGESGILCVAPWLGHESDTEVPPPEDVATLDVAPETKELKGVAVAVFRVDSLISSDTTRQTIWTYMFDITDPDNVILGYSSNPLVTTIGAVEELANPAHLRKEQHSVHGRAWLIIVELTPARVRSAETGDPKLVGALVGGAIALVWLTVGSVLLLFLHDRVKLYRSLAAVESIIWSISRMELDDIPLLSSVEEPNQNLPWWKQRCSGYDSRHHTVILYFKAIVRILQGYQCFLPDMPLQHLITTPLPASTPGSKHLELFGPPSISISHNDMLSPGARSMRRASHCDSFGKRFVFVIQMQCTVSQGDRSMVQAVANTFFAEISHLASVYSHRGHCRITSVHANTVQCTLRSLPWKEPVLLYHSVARVVRGADLSVMSTSQSAMKHELSFDINGGLSFGRAVYGLTGQVNKLYTVSGPPADEAALLCELSRSNRLGLLVAKHFFDGGSNEQSSPSRTISPSTPQRLCEDALCLGSLLRAGNEFYYMNDVLIAEAVTSQSFHDSADDRLQIRQCLNRSLTDWSKGYISEAIASVSGLCGQEPAPDSKPELQELQRVAQYVLKRMRQIYCGSEGSPCSPREPSQKWTSNFVEWGHSVVRQTC